MRKTMILSVALLGLAASPCFAQGGNTTRSPGESSGQGAPIPENSVPSGALNSPSVGGGSSAGTSASGGLSSPSTSGATSSTGPNQTGSMSGSAPTQR